MALYPRCLRRALSLSYFLLEHPFHGYKAKPIPSTSASRLLPTPTATTQFLRRPFTSTTTVFGRAFNPETDEIGPDTVLFEGCDYKHWLITVDFPKDSNITREQMIETYVNIAAQVFGSVEEAKKRIYALSTTTYHGFQVECLEQTSEKFKSIPAVVFVLPDSYIDPVNKEYGGDKYVNGEIFPRPPPVHYGRRSNRDRHPREQNYGPPSQQNYGPPPHQNYGPPPQQNFRPSQQPNYAPPPYQNYASPQRQNYRPPQQGYTPQLHQSSSTPPQQSHMLNTQGSHQGSFNRAGPETHSAPRQGNFQNHAQPGPRGFAQDANYGSSQDGAFEQVSGGRRNVSTSEYN